MLNLTLSETIRALNNGRVFPNYHILSILELLIEEKEELQKEAILASECKDAFFSIIDQKIMELVKSGVDYNEKHIDSHGNYADCVVDDYVYNNRQKELLSFCAENGTELSSVDIDQLENKLFDIMTSQSVHQFCGRPYYDKFVLACFAFGEHEIQIDFDQIGDCVTLEIMQHMKDNRLLSEYCGSLDKNSALFYQPSNMVLEFSVSLEQIKETLADMLE